MSRNLIAYMVLVDGNVVHEDDFDSLSEHDHLTGTQVLVDEADLRQHEHDPVALWHFLQGVMVGKLSTSKVRW